jgi:hypothetical protein
MLLQLLYTYTCNKNKKKFLKNKNVPILLEVKYHARLLFWPRSTHQGQKSLWNKPFKSCNPDTKPRRASGRKQRPLPCTRFMFPFHIIIILVQCTVHTVHLNPHLITIKWRAPLLLYLVCLHWTNIFIFFIKIFGEAGNGKEKKILEGERGIPRGIKEIFAKSRHVYTLLLVFSSLFKCQIRFCCIYRKQ